MNYAAIVSQRSDASIVSQHVMILQHVLPRCSKKTQLDSYVNCVY